MDFNQNDVVLNAMTKKHIEALRGCTNSHVVKLAKLILSKDSLMVTAVFDKKDIIENRHKLYDYMKEWQELDMGIVYLRKVRKETDSLNPSIEALHFFSSHMAQNIQTYLRHIIIENIL